MIFGIVFNFVSVSVYYFWLRESEHGPDHSPILLDEMHQVLWWMSMCLLIICIPLYVLSVSLDPGYLQPVYDYK